MVPFQRITSYKQVTGARGFLMGVRVRSSTLSNDGETILCPSKANFLATSLKTPGTSQKTLQSPYHQLHLASTGQVVSGRLVNYTFAFLKLATRQP
jgi:hypothetical protein